MPTPFGVPVEPEVVGVAWLQHGYARNPLYLSTLAGALASAGLVVGMPKVGSFRRSRSINDVGFLDSIGSALGRLGDPDGVVATVARAAGVPVAPAVARRLVLVGHSAGCAVLARAARRQRSRMAEMRRFSAAS